MSYLDIVLEEKKKYWPKKGFNVVIFDDFERPGEMLSLIAHTDTKEEAEEVKEKLKGATVYIYGVR